MSVEGPGGGDTVLVVDDDFDIARYVELNLSLEGFTVHVAHDGEAAVTKAQELRPDAVLLDVMMPELDGPTTVARLQADPRTRGIGIVLLTAKVQPSELARFDEMAGVAGVIAKPFDPMALPGQVAEILGWDGA
jgi:CheY-like chemotaxis protein